MKRLLTILLCMVLISGCGAQTREVFAPQASPAPTVSPAPSPIRSAQPAPPLSPLPTAASPTPAAAATPDTAPASEASQTQTVSIAITGPTENDIILAPTSVDYREGQTVFEVLLAVTRENNIQTDFSGNNKTAYVKGINNLYEFDMGGTSGWLYSVNGAYPKISCGAYMLKSGDSIQFEYTTEVKAP